MSWCHFFQGCLLSFWTPGGTVVIISGRRQVLGIRLFPGGGSILDTSPPPQTHLRGEVRTVGEGEGERHSGSQGELCPVNREGHN